MSAPNLPLSPVTEDIEEDSPDELIKQVVNIDLRNLGKPSVRFKEDSTSETGDGDGKEPKTASDNSQTYIKTPLQPQGDGSSVSKKGLSGKKGGRDDSQTTKDSSESPRDKPKNGKPLTVSPGSQAAPSTVVKDNGTPPDSDQAKMMKNRRSAFKRASLEAFLPRKNFFNSHDKVLRDAGLAVDDHDTSNKKPDWKKIYRLPSYVAAINAGTEGKDGEVPNKDETFEAPSEEDVITAMQNQAKVKKTKPKAVKVLEETYKPLLDYLKYVAENPHEYIHASKFSVRNNDHLHPSPLVRKGRAFQKGQHGSLRDNIFIHALSWLKPKAIDLAVSRQAKEKPSKKDTKTDTTGEQGASGEEAKTELERLKIKAEKWMKGLSTIEYLKAKELALSAVGQEDANFTKWWIAFKGCRYLRPPPSKAPLQKAMTAS